jgi:hypothetical protein
MMVSRKRMKMVWKRENGIKKEVEDGVMKKNEDGIMV